MVQPSWPFTFPPLGEGRNCYCRICCSIEEEEEEEEKGNVKERLCRDKLGPGELHNEKRGCHERRSDI